jgi:molecular chaperone GrpE
MMTAASRRKGRTLERRFVLRARTYIFQVEMSNSRQPEALPPDDPNMPDDPSPVDGAEAVGPESIPSEPPPVPDPLAQAREEAHRLKDAWMRTAADFDNFRKRTRREIDDARRGGREDLLKEMLPVFDNLERGMQSAKQATDVKAVVDGLSMILKQFDSTLARVGIQKVPTIGTPFDPMLHEAIQQVETSEHPPGTVVAEVQPGYAAGDKLIRAAMVVVAKPKSEEPGASN